MICNSIPFADNMRHPILNVLSMKQGTSDGPGRALDGLCLVQDHVVPADALEVLDVLDDELVAGDDDVERCFLRVDQLRVPELTQHLPILCVTPVRHHLVDKYNIIVWHFSY